ncbi:MAG TPA: hypothetical protein VKH19_08120 [Gemmatimonadaceae bacterium]|nr:hypothetical protein [Gemmatimonadaceae bacterium]
MSLLLTAGDVHAQVEPSAIRPRLPAKDSLFDSTFVVQQARDSTTRANAEQNHCWRPHRAPTCPGFFLTELAVEVPIGSTRRDDSRRDFEIRPVWSFGFMGSKGRNSFGGTSSLTGDPADDSYIPYTLEARYRRWLGNRWSADLSAGFKHSAIWRNGMGLVGGHGMTAMLSVVANPYVGVALRTDIMRGGGRTARSLMGGVTSTRASEFLLKTVALGALRATLGAIGIHVDEDDEE